MDTRVCVCVFRHVHCVSIVSVHKNTWHTLLAPTPAPPHHHHKPHRPRLIKLAVLAITLKKWAKRRNDDSSTCNYAGLLSHYTHCIWLPASSLSYIICAKPTQLSLPALWAEAESELAAFRQGRPGGRLSVLFFPSLLLFSRGLDKSAWAGRELGAGLIGRRGKGGRMRKRCICMMRWLTRGVHVCDGRNGDNIIVVCWMVWIFSFNCD